MSRILVTGSSGRLGRSVVDVLGVLGHEVIEVDLTMPADSELSAAQQIRAERFAADLTDPAAASAVIGNARADAVIHLAAIAVPFSAPEQHILRTNAALAYNVMQAAVDAGVRKIVTASSPTVFGYGSPAGWVPERLPLDEDVEPRPWNAYALSKLLAERTMQMFAAQKGDDVRLAAFRPCYVIAPEEWAGAPTQQGHTVLERLDDAALSAPALFNYVDARDVAYFLDTLLERIDEIPNAQTFIVGAADALARRPLAELMPQYWPAAAEASGGLTGTAPAFSIEKARRLLGWEPRHDWRTELELSMSPAERRSAG
ncbi:NAD(P)-dependent oxidoreductase [Planctomonas sp. JC2975]|uniref:NAD-dependent epimerase/dehydratase family protein n=1 Tax=Planctomonas sp. JC2975 TaxID=2729626 RepID=UPI001474F9EF|nr:NAD(P)-dependent oxidoreductase [Planctomonas sp. JC2975]NNC12788.1 NAD(P)-dependent oxidoreductase [Planctomonas sp. JC2975]